MPIEIERKFLVAHDTWRAQVTSATRIRQGYLCVEAGRTVRVRLAGEQGWLTIKGPGAGRELAPNMNMPCPRADATGSSWTTSACARRLTRPAT
jgi:CYTH domain-containing protein